MKVPTECLVERAMIDILFARAELLSAKDAMAVFRALEHIDGALLVLKILAPRYDSCTARMEE
jgi:hypothetical protein